MTVSEKADEFLRRVKAEKWPASTEFVLIVTYQDDRGVAATQRVDLGGKVSVRQEGGQPLSPAMRDFAYEAWIGQVSDNVDSLARPFDQDPTVPGSPRGVRCRVTNVEFEIVQP